jgi:hypothetical protein
VTRRFEFSSTTDRLLVSKTQSLFFLVKTLDFTLVMLLSFLPGASSFSQPCRLSLFTARGFQFPALTCQVFGCLSQICGFQPQSRFLGD